MDIATLNRPSFQNDALLGGPGYSLPEQGEIITFEDLSGQPRLNLRISGNAGRDNRVVINPRADLRNALTIYCNERVSNAVVVVGEACELHGDIHLFGADQTVILSGGKSAVGHTGHFSAQLWNACNALFIGKGSTTNGNQYIIDTERHSIVVGDDCMFATDIVVRNSDQHAIIDMLTGEIRNPSASVVIEPHVWLGEGALICKGVLVGLGSVVAAHSVVSRSCPRFSLVGGVPANILSKDVTWDRHSMLTRGLLDDLRAFAERVPILQTGVGGLRQHMPIRSGRW